MPLGRRTPSRETVAVLPPLLEVGDAKLYGLEASRLAGLPFGSLYPLLALLEETKVLSGRSAGDYEMELQRGRRCRCYRFTPSGCRVASTYVQRARTQLGVSHGALGPRGGM